MKKEVASFSRRIIAYVVDILIINVLILRPFKLFSRADLSFSFSKGTIIVGLSVSILTLLYFTLLELTVRQTIGKMLTRIYVASTKEKLALNQCFLRNISKIATIVLFFDVLYAVITKTHQRYFEKLSSTEVLQIREKK